MFRELASPDEPSIHYPIAVRCACLGLAIKKDELVRWLVTNTLDRFLNQAIVIREDY